MISPLWRGRMRRARAVWADPIILGLIFIGGIAILTKAPT